MARERPVDRLGKLEEEFLREKAAVLARIAGTLEGLRPRSSLVRARLDELYPIPEPIRE